MTIGCEHEEHTGGYRDVTGPPVGVFVSVGSFVSREWGENYRIGYVGEAAPDDDALGRGDAWTFVFQVKASDGSRFAVGATRWGQPFELEGRVWLAFLRAHGVEATVRGCGARS